MKDDWIRKYEQKEQDRLRALQSQQEAHERELAKIEVYGSHLVESSLIERVKLACNELNQRARRLFRYVDGKYSITVLENVDFIMLDEKAKESWQHGEPLDPYMTGELYLSIAKRTGHLFERLSIYPTDLGIILVFRVDRGDKWLEVAEKEDYQDLRQRAEAFDCQGVFDPNKVNEDDIREVFEYLMHVRLDKPKLVKRAKQRRK